MKKRYVYRKRKRNIKIVQKKLIIGIMTLIVIISCSFMIKAKFEKDQQKIYTKAEEVQDFSTENNEENNMDNSGYIPLDKDSNADDAIELFHVTEKLIKGELKYPIHTDGKKVVYLTFDDGPSTTNTPKVLDILKENEIKATFMIMGKNAEHSNQSKEILRRTAKEGHAIGNHTYSHDYKYLYPNRTIDKNNFMADVEKCNQALKNILGKDFSTRVIRFPGGYWSWKGRENIRTSMDEKGYAIIDWNTLSGDAEGSKPKNANELVEELKTNLEKLGKNADSVIVLMHDTYGKEETVKSLQSIIDVFKEKGFEFRTIK
ncbi:polysaccharide deacetylase [Clostridium sp. SHJSY1]|uniref:polysaccharide deacetylase family protein n=1 Tax=Clostridium sp. SHJSY1 TaxID=2942483 RepID=UPI002875D07E|nr:polysaccharide deacetylase family protein [Clostridium sp. SHJSY1]MDS0528580.1 polysaccharide deacetylase [Clostridium sp. SHJSY1]